MSYRVRVALKVAVWIGSLWPLGVLVRGFLIDEAEVTYWGVCASCSHPDSP